jgi:hypothetical protein
LVDDSYSVSEFHLIKKQLAEEYPKLYSSLLSTKVAQPTLSAMHTLLYRISKSRFYGMNMFDATVTKNNKFLSKDVPD